MIIFDIDGTVLPATSCERLFVSYLFHNKVIGPPQFISFGVRGITLLPKGFAFALKANKGYLKGFSTDQISSIAREFFAREIEPRIPKTAIERINDHKRRGERVIIFSGMPDFLLANFAEFLGVQEYYGSVMETKSEKYTGRTLGAFPLGRGKVRIISKLLSETSLDWSDITFYGDHWMDRFLLSRVGKPMVVNPGKRLLSMAKRRRWHVEKFQ